MGHFQPLYRQINYFAFSAQQTILESSFSSPAEIRGHEISYAEPEIYKELAVPIQGHVMPYDPATQPLPEGELQPLADPQQTNQPQPYEQQVALQSDWDVMMITPQPGVQTQSNDQPQPAVQSQTAAESQLVAYTQPMVQPQMPPHLHPQLQTPIQVAQNEPGCVQSDQVNIFKERRLSITQNKNQGINESLFLFFDPQHIFCGIPLFI